MLTAAAPPPLADLAFEGEVIVWRGPAPFHFVAVPPEHVAELHRAARAASYGWGVVPVTAAVAGILFRTSLFPRDGGYLVPLKTTVRAAAHIGPGDRVRIELQVFARD